MKYILSIIFAFAFALCGVRAQNVPEGFTVKGRLGGDTGTDSIFIYNMKEERLAAAPVVNGKFELKGSVDEPCHAVIAILEEDELQDMGRLILDNENYTYSRNGWHVKIKGGRLHDMVLGFESSDEFHKASDDYDEFLDALFVGKDENTTIEDVAQEDKDKLRKLGKIILAIEDKALIPVIESPGAPFLAKAYAIGRIQNWEKYSPEKRLELLKGYREKLEKTNRDLEGLIQGYQDELEALETEKNVSGGERFKDIEARDSDGNIVKLSDVIARNKYTILEFWASWCDPCRGEIPNLKKAYGKYKTEGLEIYAVSFDDNHGKWLKALNEENVPWISLIDATGFKGKAAKGYAVRGVPASFLIRQDGVIVVSNERLRGKELEKTLSEFFK